MKQSVLREKHVDVPTGLGLGTEMANLCVSRWYSLKSIHSRGGIIEQNRGEMSSRDRSTTKFSTLK